MAGELHCPREQCGAWGIPLEGIEAVATLTPEDLDPANEECCLWHEVELKCIRDPRYAQDPEAEDYFNNADEVDQQNPSGV